MPYRDIVDDAVDANSPFTTHLARAFRDNILHLDHSRQALDSALHGTTGHQHTAAGTRTTTYNFSDRIEVVSGVRDKIDLVYEDATYTFADAVTLTAGTRTPTAHAAMIESVMDTAIGGSSYISVTFDTTDGSPTRGLFLVRNLAPTGTRRLELLGKSGTNAANSAMGSIGFGAKDYKKALGYASESGSLDGYLIDSITLSEGGEIDTAGFVDLAFTNGKFTNSIIPTGAIQDGAVTGAKTAGGSITSPKFGLPIPSVPGTVFMPAGATQVFTFTMTGRGASIIPCICAFSANGLVAQGILTVTGIASAGGDDYTCTVTNTGSTNISSVGCVAL